jgi:hypothetical protein
MGQHYSTFKFGGKSSTAEWKRIQTIRQMLKGRGWPWDIETDPMIIVKTVRYVRKLFV